MQYLLKGKKNSYRWIENLQALGQTVSVGGDGVLGPALQHVQVGSHRLHLIGEVEVSNLFLGTQGRNLQKVKRRGAPNVQIHSL